MNFVDQRILILINKKVYLRQHKTLFRKIIIKIIIIILNLKNYYNKKYNCR